MSILEAVETELLSHPCSQGCPVCLEWFGREAEVGDLWQPGDARRVRTIAGSCPRWSLDRDARDAALPMPGEHQPANSPDAGTAIGRPPYGAYDAASAIKEFQRRVETSELGRRAQATLEPDRYTELAARALGIDPGDVTREQRAVAEFAWRAGEEEGGAPYEGFDF